MDALAPSTSPDGATGDVSPAGDAGEAAASAGDLIPGAVIVGFIAVLVLVVSMPRFRAHVVTTSRAEAPRTLRLLGATLFDTDWESKVEGGDTPETLLELVRGIPALRHRFRDARGIHGSSELSHHGYLIDTGRVMDAQGPRTALVAWPLNYARTGDAAFALCSDGQLWVHQNGGLWTGLARPLVDVDVSDEGWVRRDSKSR